MKLNVFSTAARPVCLCSAAVLLASLQTAWAQTESGNLPTVTVVAGQLEQKRFDAPAAASSVDAATIRASGPQVNLSDALGSVPGVVALNRNNYAQDVQISIRGFGSRAAFGLQGIRLIADGIPATIPDGQGQASTVSLTSADRIEVLRGPLAQLYGNSSGGVIQTFTREAGANTEFSAQTFAGSYGLRRYDVQASGRGADGRMGLVADLSEFQIDGWRANSAAKRQQFNSVLTLDPVADTRIKLIANGFRMPQAQDPLGLSATQLAANASQAGTNAVLDQTRKLVSQDQGGLVLQQRLSGDLRLQASVYYGTRDNTQYQAGSSQTAPTNANGTWVGLSRVFNGTGLELRGRVRQAWVPMDWAVGYHADRSTEHRQGGATKLGLMSGLPTRDEQNTARNNDWFAQTNWYPNDSLTVVAGARASQVTLNNQDHYLSDGNDSGSVTYRAVTPVLGATWHVAPHWNLYANVGRGLETPTLTALAYSQVGNTIVNKFNPNLLASTSEHAEIGSKWEVSPSNSLEADVFQIRTRNEVVSALSNAGKTAYTNAPQTLRQGIELAWQAQLAAHWSSRWAATAISAKYDSSFSSAGTTIARGNYLPAVPSRQVNGSITWREQDGSASATKLRGTEVNLDWSARSHLWANDVNTAYAPGMGQLNLRLRQGFTLGRAEAQAFLAINNLTDRRSVGSVITNQASGQYYEPGLPRNWTLGVKVDLPS